MTARTSIVPQERGLGVVCHAVVICEGKRLYGGPNEGYFGATCTFTPEADGYVLAPHEAKTFDFECDLAWASGNLTDLSYAEELTATVYVYGASNQLGEFRDQTWNATSPTYKFE